MFEPIQISLRGQEVGDYACLGHALLQRLLVEATRAFVINGPSGVNVGLECARLA